MPGRLGSIDMGQTVGQMDQRTEILILENRMCENKKHLTNGWMLPYLMWTDTNDFEAKFRLVRI